MGQWQHRRPIVSIGLQAVLVAASSIFLQACPPPAPFQSCVDDGDCPHGYTCKASTGVCRRAEIVTDAGPAERAVADAARGEGVAPEGSPGDIGPGERPPADGGRLVDGSSSEGPLADGPLVSPEAGLPDTAITPSNAPRIWRSLSVSPGADLVVRAIASSDGQARPIVRLVDVARSEVLSQAVGSRTSTPRQPDVLMFSAEAPGADRDAGLGTLVELRVELASDSATGSVLWHQIELLPNVLDNPGLERLAAQDPTPYAPASWWIQASNDGRDIRTLTRNETSQVHGGAHALGLRAANAPYEKRLLSEPGGLSDGAFYALGAWFFKADERAVGIPIGNASYFAQNLGYQSQNNKLKVVARNVTGTWLHVGGVARRCKSPAAACANVNNWNDIVRFGNSNYQQGLDAVIDDTYMLALPAVVIEPRPSPLGSSHANGSWRVDGADLVQQAFVPGLRDAGVLSFDAALGRPVGTTVGACEANSVLFSFYGDAANYLRVEFNDAGALEIYGAASDSDFILPANGFSSATLSHGETHIFSLSVAGRSLIFAIDSVAHISGDMPIEFGAPLTTLTFGSTADRTRRCDLSLQDPGATLQRGANFLDGGRGDVLLIADGAIVYIDGAGFERAPHDAGPGRDSGWTCPGYRSDCTPPVTLRQAMGLRSGLHPFDWAPIFQGDLSRPHSIGDVLRYNTAPESLAAGFSGLVDVRQGSLLMWVKPEWSSTQLAGSEAVLAEVAGLQLRVTEAQIQVWSGGSARLIWGQSGQAGELHLIVLRWDRDAPLDSMGNHLLLTVDNSTVGGVVDPLADADPGAVQLVGAGPGGTDSANALIAGFTVYRRPLWDGQWGVDVGNGNELQRVWDSRADVVNITGSWDVVFALPSTQVAGRLRANGSAWTHPHASNLLGAAGWMDVAQQSPELGWQVDPDAPAHVTPLDASESVWGAGLRLSPPR